MKAYKSTQNNELTENIINQIISRHFDKLYSAEIDEIVDYFGSQENDYSIDQIITSLDEEQLARLVMLNIANFGVFKLKIKEDIQKAYQEQKKNLLPSELSDGLGNMFQKGFKGEL